jgi:hypothetical protein
LSRRPHPYFSRLNRLLETPAAASERARAPEPTVTPESEPGVLWEALRAPDAPAGDSA